MIGVFLIILVVLGLYAIMGLWMLTRKAPQQLPTQKASPSMCVVIAARNEAENLSSLLPKLMGKELRVIVANDHSTDETEEVARKQGAEVVLSAGEGKKAALKTAVEKVGEEWILFLDADVLVEEKFLTDARDAISKQSASVCLFPIKVQNPKGFRQHFDASDMASLIFTTKAFADAGRAIMGNGAAMAVRASFYRSSLEHLRNDIASGDDTFLVQHAVQTGEEVRFVDAEGLTVGIAANPSWSAFFKQRIRWGKKTTAYQSDTAKFIGWLVFLSNLIVCLAWIAAPWNLDLLYIPLFKGIIDLDFFHRISGRLQQKHLRKYLLLTVLIYPFYISAAALGGLFVSPEWKGRRS